MMKLSVVVPVYNAMPYLKQTFESISDQCYMNMEIIFVNDGSTDDSRKYLEECCVNDKRVVLLNKKNGGLSSARNYGLDYASGDYIWFVDADDKMVSNAAMDLSNYISQCIINPDILFSNAQLFDNNGGKSDKQYMYDTAFLRQADSNNVLCYLFSAFGNVWSVWAHLYRLQFIRDNKIRYDESLRRGEDIDWMLNVILQANSFDAYRDYIYEYRTDSIRSIHSTYSFSHFMGGINTSIKWFRFFQSQYTNTARQIMLRYLSEFFVVFSGYIGKLKGKERTIALKIYRDNFDIAQYQQISSKTIHLNNFF